MFKNVRILNKIHIYIQELKNELKIIKQLFKRVLESKSKISNYLRLLIKNLCI
jgi:hypothetical protein